MHIAAKHYDPAIVAILLKYGADVNNIGYEIENIHDETIEIPEDNDPRSEEYVCNIINKFYEMSALNLAVKNN